MIQYSFLYLFYLPPNQIYHSEKDLTIHFIVLEIILLKVILELANDIEIIFYLKYAL